MGRKPTITREKLLELAEEIVRTDGVKALTVDALAQAAKISKGGVQYSFASKDELIKALVDRWTSQFDAELADNDDQTMSGIIRRYIAVTRTSQGAMNAKLAGLMIAYIQDPENLKETRAWYQSMFDKFAGKDPDAQAVRVAFLAVEGLFQLRIAGIDEEGAWLGFLDDVEAVLSRLLD